MDMKTLHILHHSPMQLHSSVGLEYMTFTKKNVVVSISSFVNLGVQSSGSKYLEKLVKAYNFIQVVSS